MRRRIWITFALVVLLTAAAGYVDYPGSPPLTLGKFQKSFDTRLGLDLLGGTRLVYDAETSDIASNEREDALQGVRDVIERRVNAFGVSEPNVQTNRVGDQWRVSVELAGIQDIQQAITLIGETPLLEFREEGENVEQPRLRSDDDAVKRAEEALAKLKQPSADWSALAIEYSDDPGSKGSGGDLGFVGRGAFVPEFEATLFDQLADGQVAPSPIKTEFGFHLIQRIESRQADDGQGGTSLEVHGRHILVATLDRSAASAFTPTSLSGKNLQSASVQFEPQTGQPQVSLQFDSEGSNLFAEITKRNIGKRVAIYLDGSPISVPVVQQEITGGQAVISGDFTIEDAKTLSRRLNAGALPVAITLVGQQTIGPTLGQASIARSFFAGVVGLLTVAVFMIVFYRLPGLLATVALLFYALIVLAIFKLWPVTLTIAGVAGFILSIGMAVDANILIFERIREELRSGRLFQSALDEGFRRAWLSIRDSNVSSLLTAVILAWFGSSVVKGFAITLSIGIVVSMFSAITVTRTMLRLLSSQWLDRHRGLIGPHLRSTSEK